MSFGDQPPGFGPGEGRPPTEEELRAAYEEEIKRVRVEDVIVQTVVSLINLGVRKAGIAPGTEGEADAEQLQQSIEASRALLPFIEDALGEQAGQLHEALSQLQIAYARMVSGEAPAAPEGPSEGPPPAAPPQQGPADAGTGPAQSSGRLWVPGQ
ncbi:MAG: hypothetical protein JHC95_03045 [Solirubrobacteraceae bacterium]|nr:hypothetical protein [Solirubrobacteraceae bacterium]